MIQAPKIAATEIDPSGRVVTHVIFDDGDTIFDTDLLQDSPKKNFKNMSIGDFDLYCRCAFWLALDSEFADDIEMEMNRIERTFRMKVSPSKSNRFGIPVFEDTLNSIGFENLMNALNLFFGLVPEIHYSYALQVCDTLSEIVRRSCSFWSEWRGYPGFTSDLLYCPHDIALVFNKMCPDAAASDWLRKYWRGRKDFMTINHPEFLT